MPEIPDGFPSKLTDEDLAAILNEWIRAYKELYGDPGRQLRAEAGTNQRRPPRAVKTRGRRFRQISRASDAMGCHRRPDACSRGHNAHRGNREVKRGGT